MFWRQLRIQTTGPSLIASGEANTRMQIDLFSVRFFGLVNPTSPPDPPVHKRARRESASSDEGAVPLDDVQ